MLSSSCAHSSFCQPPLSLGSLPYQDPLVWVCRGNRAVSNSISNQVSSSNKVRLIFLAVINSTREVPRVLWLLFHFMASLPYLLDVWAGICSVILIFLLGENMFLIFSVKLSSGTTTEESDTDAGGNVLYCLPWELNHGDAVGTLTQGFGHGVVGFVNFLLGSKMEYGVRTRASRFNGQLRQH